MSVVGVAAVVVDVVVVAGSDADVDVDADVDAGTGAGVVGSVGVAAAGTAGDNFAASTTCHAH